MRSLSAAVVFLALGGTAVRAEDAIPPEVLEAIKAATVFVKVEVEGLSASGSGFVIKADGQGALVVTNHHVVEPKVETMVVVPDRRPSRPVPPRPFGPHPSYRPPMPAPGVPTYTPRLMVRTFKNAVVSVVFRSGTKQEEAVPAQVLAADPEQDLAVLKVSGVHERPKPIDYLHDPKLSETMPVYIFGFPFGKVLATSKGSPAITVGKGSISSLRLNDDGELALVQIDGALNPGNSGGPVVDTQGRLVGVAVATIKNSSGIGLAIPSRELSAMLRGRLGKVYLHASQDGEGPPTVHVEVGLIDPLHRIKSVALHYLLASKVPEKIKPSDPLGSLLGCRKLPLRIDNQLATGEFTLKKGVPEVALRYQAAYVDSDNKRGVTGSVAETVKPKGAEVAKKTAEPKRTAEPKEAGEAKEAGGAKETIQPKPVETARKPPVPREPPAAKDTETLVADLESGDMGRIIRATHQLIQTRPKGPNPAVAKALETVLAESGLDPLRSNAARALQNWGTLENIPALEKAAAKDPSSIVQRTAKEAIRRIKLAAEE